MQHLSTLAMATTISFQKKVRKKVEDKEENNNNDSLVCEICSVVCKSNANLKKHKQRTHDDREFTCDTCGIKVTGLEKFNMFITTQVKALEIMWNS